jgi:phospholipid transport system substrate-binding protein
MAAARRFILVVAMLLLLVNSAWGRAPTDQLKESIDKAVKILENPTRKRAAMVKVRRVAIREVVEEIFDFPETARRALGLHWRSRTAAEREEFVKLFKDLLERTYISKIELYGGEKIVYIGDAVDGDHATVRTRIITKQGAEVPMDYRMLRREDRWLVYDVSIEGVSLISNYRTQFNRIIETSSYQELVKKMEAKLEELSFKDQAKARNVTKNR